MKPHPEALRAFLTAEDDSNLLVLVAGRREDLAEVVGQVLQAREALGVPLAVHSLCAGGREPEEITTSIAGGLFSAGLLDRPPDADPELRRDQLADLLRSTKRRIAILIDGLDLVSSAGLNLCWLPFGCRPGVRVVVTTRPGLALEVLELRPGVVRREVGPLGPGTPADEAPEGTPAPAGASEEHLLALAKLAPIDFPARTRDLLRAAVRREAGFLSSHPDAVFGVVYNLARGQDPETDRVLEAWRTAFEARAGSVWARALRTPEAPHGMVLRTASLLGAGLDASGGRLVTVTRDGWVRLHELDSAREVAKVRSQIPPAAENLVMSEDGQRFAVVARGTDVTVIDVRTGRKVSAFFHGKGVSEWRFDPSGSRLEVTGDDEVVRLLDVATGKPARSTGPAAGEAQARTTGPRGLVGRGPCALFVQDSAARPPSSERPSPWGGPHSRVRAVSDGGTRILLTEDDRESRAHVALRVVDAPEDRVLWETRLEARSLRSIEPGPGGALLVALSRDRALLLEGETGREVLARQSEGDEWIGSAAWAPDGRRIAVGLDSGRILILECPSGQEVTSLPAPHPGLAILAFSPDGARLASAGGNRKIRLRDLPSGQERWAFPIEGSSKSIAFSPEGRRIAVGLEGGRLVVVEADSGKGAVLAGHTASVVALAFDEAGERIASASKDGTVRVWEAADHRCVETLRRLDAEHLAGGTLRSAVGWPVRPGEAPPRWVAVPGEVETVIERLPGRAPAATIPGASILRAVVAGTGGRSFLLEVDPGKERGDLVLYEVREEGRP